MALAAVALITSLITPSSAHMIMNTPTPYNFHGTAKLIQVDPLGPAKPFPCHGLSDIVSVTQLTAGTNQLVKFSGGAQHGGGSCQFSVTYEYPPPADPSKWSTIYTLIGGCPVSAEGNLPVVGKDQDGRDEGPQCGNDSGQECIRQFEVPIPKGLKNGKATFAWSWFNNIGNREMYHNCAPVEITGGTGNEEFVKSLLPPFVANVEGKCTTGEGVLNIPNPGRFGQVLEQPAPGSEGTCAKAEGVPTFEGRSGSGSGSGSGTASGTGSVVVTPPTASASVVPTSSVTTTFSVISTSSAPIPTAGAGTGGTGTGAGEGSVRACSPDGAIICLNSTTFGICNYGRVIPQAVAPGTICANGKITRRQWKGRFKLYQSQTESVDNVNSGTLHD